MIHNAIDNATTIVIKQAGNGWIITTAEAAKPAVQERIQAAKAAWKDDDDATERIIAIMREHLETVQYQPPPPPRLVTHVSLDSASALKHLADELRRLELGDEIDQQIRAVMRRG